MGKAHASVNQPVVAFPSAEKVRTNRAEDENEEEGKDVRGYAVLRAWALRTTRWFCWLVIVILSS